MAKIGRPGLSPEKRADLWKRWKSGQCASDIARSLERTKGCPRRLNFDPPCRLTFDPGTGAAFGTSGCG